MGEADEMTESPRKDAAAASQDTSTLDRDALQTAVGSGKLGSPPPIREAIKDAFQDSPAQSQIDPELIKILTVSVTEQVMKNLAQQQAAGTNPLALLTPQTSPVLPFLAPMAPSESMSHRNTPPTPSQRSESRWSYDFSNPELATSDAGSQLSQHSPGGATSPSLRNRDSPTLPAAEMSNTKSTTRAQPSVDADASSTSGDTDLQSKSTAQRSGRVDSRFSGSQNETVRSPSTPPDHGETALERAWQPLFVGGIPTARLGAFLRGLALHLIDNYEPKGSLVVTPSKMLRFLNDTKVPEEYYPWHTIYSRLAPDSLSKVYRNLGCPHHLVQRTSQDHPTVPGLTPIGFEYFMTFLIQAHPDLEFERLDKAVKNMPISSADDRTHRFPKELSRRLFPSDPNPQAQQRLVSSMSHEPSVMGDLRGSVAIPPPPASAPPSQSAPPSVVSENPPQPYAQNSSASGFLEDEDLSPALMPIERERKPYTAREGSGKVYEGEDVRPPFSHYKTDSSAGARASRSNSGLPPQAMYPSISQPMNIPHRNHRGSVGQAPPSLGGYPRPMRGRSSPPPRNFYATSDPYSVGSIPDQQFGSTLNPSRSSPTPTSYVEDAYQRSFYPPSRSDRASTANAPGPPSNASGMSRGVPNQSRNAPPNNAYEFPVGSLGGPVGEPPPPSSYSSRRSMPPPPPNAGPERRRSLFTSASMNQGGDSGSDVSNPYIDSMNGKFRPPPAQQYGPPSQY